MAGEVYDYASCILEGDDLYVCDETSCATESALSNCFREISLIAFGRKLLISLHQFQSDMIWPGHIYN